MFMMTQKLPLNPLKGTFLVTRAPLQGQGGLFEAIQKPPFKGSMDRFLLQIGFNRMSLIPFGDSPN